MIITYLEYEIDDNPERLDIQSIHQYLTHSYWSEGIHLKVVEKSINHSVCFGVYYKDKQIGFSRIVTDYIKFAFLADVFILSQYNGKGLGTKLLETILNYDDFKWIKKWILYTKDAHGLYQKFGFKPPTNPEYIMERLKDDWLNLVD